MTEYKTPGVYVKEVSKFPPSVAGVATAIPAFIGFTEKPEFETDSKPQAVKIKSLLDYENLFGVGPKLELNDKEELQKHNFVMYDSIRLFFDNGGSTCYVVSIGDYKTTEFKADQYTDGLEPLKKVDEVTLLVTPDAAMLLNETQLGTVHKAMLTQCTELGDRFAILDPKKTDDLNTALKDFREYVGSNGLSYGAAYYPYLKTTYSKDISFDEMLKIATIKTEAEKINQFNDYYSKKTLELIVSPFEEEVKTLTSQIDALKNEIDNLTDGDEKTAKTKEKKDAEAKKKELEGKIKELNKFSITDKGILQYDGKDITDKTFEGNPLGKEMYGVVLAAIPEIKNKKALMAKAFAAQIEGYAEKLAELQDEASIITPSGAIAGIYAATDGNKGVWQAPANMSLASVGAVTEIISDNDQAGMNVDDNAGKSVNAIRFFTGKGILVWGARTLDGNSNEWRYVSVRRLFNYVEESVQKSTNWAVFQPNDANTWVKIQCQIENFLNNLWRDGALAGSTPEKAYYVRVGLDVTMTADDINNGYLIVEIGIAAVRPAEFIVLKFSHKVQEA